VILIAPLQELKQIDNMMRTKKKNLELQVQNLQSMLELQGKKCVLQESVIEQKIKEVMELSILDMAG
jgi:hypothetical protein